MLPASWYPHEPSQPRIARHHQLLDARVKSLSPLFCERIARSAADVPEAFRAWNAGRHEHGARLREAIAAILREEPRIEARAVRARLDPAVLGRIPRLRAIQLHMQAIRRASRLEYGQEKQAVTLNQR